MLKKKNEPQSYKINCMTFFCTGASFNPLFKPKWIWLLGPFRQNHVPDKGNKKKWIVWLPDRKHVSEH